MCRRLLVCERVRDVQKKEKHKHRNTDKHTGKENIKGSIQKQKEITMAQGKEEQTDADSPREEIRERQKVSRQEKRQRDCSSLSICVSVRRKSDPRAFV